ncbi:MAG: hypothetical protein KIG53_08730 [Oscillospiraceae bacterium]|nr:hypothetical protein [Oscillospiraceae bacterium]
MAKKMPEGRPFTTETAKKCGHNGGKASGEAKRKKKLLKDCLNELLASEITDKNGVTRTGSEAAAVTLWKKFMKTGDPRIFEVIRDTAGEKPVDKVEQVTEIKVDWEDEDND